MKITTSLSKSTVEHETSSYKIYINEIITISNSYTINKTSIYVNKYFRDTFY